MNWIPVSQPPAQADANIVFDSREYLVTDGERVEIADFQQGSVMGKPWAEWGGYCGMSPASIKFWMPLPKPPAM